MREWKALGKASNLKMEVAKQRQLLHVLDPNLLTIQPYELAAVHVLNRMAMANAAMTLPQARTWACNEAGLDTGAWSHKMAGYSSLGTRVAQAMSYARRALQNIS
jgi:hypothetical protein